MSQKIDKRELDKVNGGKIGDIGWYYSIEYYNELSEAYSYTNGPFEDEATATSEGEIKRNLLLNSYSNVGPVVVKYNDKQFDRLKLWGLA